MSNGASTPVNFSQTLASFLASAVSDGTWNDVIEQLKVDQSPAQATDITQNAGQLWANVVDDMFKATWNQFFSARKLWAFADGAARDAAGSEVGVQVNDLCNLAGTDLLFYCTDSQPASSTWTAFSGGGVQPRTPRELLWTPGPSPQTESVSVNEIVTIVNAGGGEDFGRTLELLFPPTANIGQRLAIKLFGTLENQFLQISAGGSTVVDEPTDNGPSPSVQYFSADNSNYRLFYAEYEYTEVLGSNGWLLVSYWQAEDITAAGALSGVLSQGNETLGNNIVLNAEDNIFFSNPEENIIQQGTNDISAFEKPFDVDIGPQDGTGGLIPLTEIGGGILNQGVGTVVILDILAYVKYNVNNDPSQGTAIAYTFRGGYEAETGTKIFQDSEFNPGPNQFEVTTDGAVLSLQITNLQQCISAKAKGVIRAVIGAGVAGS